MVRLQYVVVLFVFVLSFFLSNFCLLKAKQDCVLTMTSLKKKISFVCLCSKISILFLCVCVSVYVFHGFFFCHNHHNINNKETYVSAFISCFAIKGLGHGFSQI